MENATVRITRNSDFFGILRKLNIYIDNKQVGGVRWNSSTDLSVSPGKHQLYVKMDWCRSKSTEFYINEDELFEYHVILTANESAFGFLKVFSDLIINYSNFYRLQKIDAKS